MSQIKGGSWNQARYDLYDNLINHLFEFSPTLGSASKFAFTYTISQLITTNAGFEILNQISARGNKIYVNGNTPANGAVGAYSLTDNTLEIGNIETDPNLVGWNMNFYNIAHEMWHAFQDNVVKNNVNSESHIYMQDAAAEIDAKIFGWTTAVEFDILMDRSFNDAASVTRLTEPMSVVAGSQGSALTAAWNAIFINGNFTLENYNALVNNFNGGSTHTPMATTTPLNSIWETGLYGFFQEFFEPERMLFNEMLNDSLKTPSQIITQYPGIHPVIPADPGPSNSGGGGGGDGSGPNPGGGGGGLPGWPPSNPSNPNAPDFPSPGQGWIWVPSFTSEKTGMPVRGHWYDPVTGESSYG